MKITALINNIYSTVIITIALIGLVLLFTPLAENSSDTTITQWIKLRGDRQVSDDLLVIFIDQNDIESLHGWPITRDYYGYLTHILQNAGAKVIAFDLLFDTHDSRYPEFDEAFADFIQSADRVCLPMAFTDLEQNTFTNSPFPHPYIGQEPRNPINIFKENCKATGFSNMGSDAETRQVPLVAYQNEKPVYSFGLEMARLFLNVSTDNFLMTRKDIEFKPDSGKAIRIPIGPSGEFRPDHFGSIENLNAISFVDLLQQYQENPDLLDVKDKLVLITVTSPGHAPLKVTPLSNALPASLVHLTVAENIISGRFIRIAPLWAQALIIFIIAALLMILYQKPIKSFIIFIIAGIILVLFISYILFSALQIIFPWMLPFVVWTISAIFIISLKVIRKEQHLTSHHDLLQQQILSKEQALQDAKAQFEKEQNKSENITTSMQQEIQKLESQIRDLQTYDNPQSAPVTVGFTNIIHTNGSPMQKVLELVQKVGSDDIPVFIKGETGSGKELIAKAIHNSGPRKSMSFVAVNCSALPDTLLESELFGHEKGSFTGAQSQRKGRFELADKGTLFLDEITETSPAFQAKLLRVLQEGTFERLGSEKTQKTDVRVIAASSKDIEKEIEQDRFRVDLYYRLNGFPVQLPPLRERRQDIPLLVQHFIDKHGYQSITGFSEQAMNQLQNYLFPGNVRELENLVRRAAIMAQSDNRQIIQSSDLPQEIQLSVQNDPVGTFVTFEDQVLESLRALQFSHSAISKTANLMNKDRGTITDYYRGICFEHFVNADFDINKAADTIAYALPEDAVSKVRSKLSDYINSLDIPAENTPDDLKKMPSFKGLPQKYHHYAEKIITYFQNKDN